MISLKLTPFLFLLLLPTGLSNPIASDTSDSISACAVILCPADTECVVRDGKAGCVPIGGEKCGPNICTKGLVCCNSSCGFCAKPGQACTMQACLGPQCGKVTCPFGEKCCNSSCGYCVKPGEGCTKELCL